MSIANRIAVSLAARDTETTLGILHRLKGDIGLAEIRIDCMRSFDLGRLRAQSPCPLVITCRPVREGGKYAGEEATRLEILTGASAIGCAYVDVEWDAVHRFENRGDSTRVIVSRHYYDSMPTDLWAQYEAMRDEADAVKLVGSAHTPRDAVRMLALVARADKPVIGIAMGGAGLISRLLAPCFPSCLLTYGAVNEESRTAPGQISVREMVEAYGLNLVGPHTEIQVDLHAGLSPQIAPAASNQSGDRLAVSITDAPEEIEALKTALAALGPRLRINSVNL